MSTIDALIETLPLFVFGWVIMACVCLIAIFSQQSWEGIKRDWKD